MATIRFIREYDFYGSKYFDILYMTPSGSRLRTVGAEDLPKTAKKWLEDKEGITQYNKTLERDEVIYKAETKYRVEFDFEVNGKDVHDYLNNNGKGFSHEDAVSVGRQLAEQGNRHVMIIAM